jgi:hypothetical protein
MVFRLEPDLEHQGHRSRPRKSRSATLCSASDVRSGALWRRRQSAARHRQHRRSGSGARAWSRCPARHALQSSNAACSSEERSPQRLWNRAQSEKFTTESDSHRSPFASARFSPEPAMHPRPCASSARCSTERWMWTGSSSSSPSAREPCSTSTSCSEPLCTPMRSAGCGDSSTCAQRGRPAEPSRGAALGSGLPPPGTHHSYRAGNQGLVRKRAVRC